MAVLYIMTGLPYAGKTTIRKELVKRAREATVEVFLKLSPGFEVFTDKKELFEILKIPK